MVPIAAYDSGMVPRVMSVTQTGNNINSVAEIRMLVELQNIMVSRCTHILTS